VKYVISTDKGRSGATRGDHRDDLVEGRRESTSAKSASVTIVAAHEQVLLRWTFSLSLACTVSISWQVPARLRENGKRPQDEYDDKLDEGDKLRCRVLLVQQVDTNGVCEERISHTVYAHSNSCRATSSSFAT